MAAGFHGEGGGREVYDRLVHSAAADVPIDEVLIGLTWTLCRTASSTGLAMSPGLTTRTLPSSGTLAGRSPAEVAGWVFMTATTLINKTFPRLAELSRNARLVLMGPTVPWLYDLAEYGVDYLAGVRVTDADKLRQTVAEGGGTRIFDEGLCYCVADLNALQALRCG